MRRRDCTAPRPTAPHRATRRATTVPRRTQTALCSCQHTSLRSCGACAQVSLRWSLQRGVAVIPKAAKESHQRQNMELGFLLSDEEMEAIDAMAQKPRSVYGFGDPDDIA